MPAIRPDAVDSTYPSTPESCPVIKRSSLFLVQPAGDLRVGRRFSLFSEICEIKCFVELALAAF